MDCSCGKKAVIFRRYEGVGYCDICLVENIEKKFRRTVRKNNLIKKGDKIAVAVSGGKDSSVLLYLMKKLQEKLPFEIFALAVDEGIEGYRNKSLEILSDFTKNMEINLHTASFKSEIDFSIDNIPKNEKHCTYCGVFRRYVLNKKARELGADKLAMGHNLDDEAQSVFMNFVRGDMSRFQRLGAFPALTFDEGFVPRIKPLRDIPEREIMAYAIIKKIPFFEGECPNSFNNIRREVQTMINNLEIKIPGTKIQMVNFYDRLKPAISKTSGGAVLSCKKCNEPSSSGVCKACELLDYVKSK